MIIVQGWVRLASAAQVEQFRDAAVTMMTATTTAEPGCLAYAFAVDLGDPALLHVVERWTDDAALAAHFASPHMATFNAALAGAQMIGADVRAYAAEEVRTLIKI